MTKKKLTQSSIQEIYSEDDGRILNQVKTATFTVDSEPSFIKLYIEDIGRLNGITTSQNKVLLEFIRHMGYNNVIPTYKPIKEMIAKNLDISLHTVNQAVKEFSKKGLFIPYVRGMYIADPNLFAKGKWSDIKNLRLVIEYGPDGTKKLKSNISEERQLKLSL